MLVHPYAGRVDHHDVAVIGLRDRREQAIPHPGRPPAHEAIVERRARSVALRHGAPVRNRQRMPLMSRRSSTRGTPRGLFGKSGSMIAHSSSLSLRPWTKSRADPGLAPAKPQWAPAPIATAALSRNSQPTIPVVRGEGSRLHH